MTATNVFPSRGLISRRRTYSSSDRRVCATNLYPASNQGALFLEVACPFAPRVDAWSRSHTPAFGSSGISFRIPGSFSPSLEILRIIPKKQTYKRALSGIYLERTCVHACIQLCTRGYTTVYTRVHSSLLGRRYSLGISRLGSRYFYLRRMLLDDLALVLW